MKKTTLFFALCILLTSICIAQNVGIGTTNPLSRLHVADGSVVFSAIGDIPVTPGNTSVSGAGRRMMWYPDKAAFRAGYVSGANWNFNNIGYYSVAMGYNPIASGAYSTAMASAIASGDYSIAMGHNANASGFFSTAMGFNATASGFLSTAMGALVNTNNQFGSFIIGDGGDGNTAHVFNNDAPNQMMMRFRGGYKLFTQGWGFNVGAQLTPGATSWSAVSDVRLKENFVPVDEEAVLQKIKNFKLSTWNYKGQDVNTMRHYGPMAQDFYAAFGKDALGKIGCDTLINEHDFISINFIAIQALEKRTQRIEELQQRVEVQQNENTSLKESVQTLNAKLETSQKQFEGFAVLQKENVSLKESMQTLTDKLESLQKQLETFTLIQKENNKHVTSEK